MGEGAGNGLNINIPFNQWMMGDSEYFLAFQQIVLLVGKKFNPDLVLISARFDVAEGAWKWTANQGIPASTANVHSIHSAVSPNISQHQCSD